jgi:hypothetical protein
LRLRFLFSTRLCVKIFARRIAHIHNSCFISHVIHRELLIAFKRPPFYRHFLRLRALATRSCLDGNCTDNRLFCRTDCSAAVEALKRRFFYQTRAGELSLRLPCCILSFAIAGQQLEFAERGNAIRNYS